MTRIFVAADHHFGHGNIIPYCRRPFKDADQMDRELVKLHNEVVGKDDVTYFLGDVTLRSPEKKDWLRKILDKMNGGKVLVFGNHDKWHWEHYLDVGFQSCHTFLKIPMLVKDKAVIVYACHDPAWAQDNRQVWVCGHLHNNVFTTESHIAVVSLERTSYRPVLLQDIAEGKRFYG